MKEFKLYDILGVIVPGTVLIAGFLMLFPQTVASLPSKELSMGDLGFVVLLAYVVGNLVAALGNIIELPYWRLFGGRHTAMARFNDGRVLPKRQMKALEKQLHEFGMLNASESIGNLTAQEWRSLTRQMHAHLDVRNMIQRIEVFNAQYGMNRGIAAGFIALIAATFIQAGLSLWRVDVVLLTCAALATFRMHRFSFYYASELLRQFLVAPKEPPTSKEHQPDSTKK